MFFDELFECLWVGINGDKCLVMLWLDLWCDDDIDNMKEMEEFWDMNYFLVWYVSSSYSFILCRIFDVCFESFCGIVF